MRNSASPISSLKPRASVANTTPAGEDSKQPQADSYLEILKTESMMATCLKEDTRANFKIHKMIEKRRKLQEEIYKMKLEVQAVQNEIVDADPDFMPTPLTIEEPQKVDQKNVRKSQNTLQKFVTQNR